MRWLLLVIGIICGLAILAWGADVSNPAQTIAAEPAGWLIQGGGIGAGLVLLHRWIESVRADMREFRADMRADLRSLAESLRSNKP